ncbi:MAG: hypothetical protein ACI4ON_07580 [Clostridia bacterium]
MIIYDDVKKNFKIVIYSKQADILNKVAQNIEKDEFKVEIYNNLDKLYLDLNKKKIKILVYLFEHEDEIDKVKSINKNIKYIFYPCKDINVDMIKLEVIYLIRLIEKEEKIDFEKYKLEIVGNLVESISHKVQSNLLVLGASQDIIKMINSELNLSNQKKEVVENLYKKNDDALQKSNMLLQLVSNATSISSESVMHCNDIEEIIKVILDEYLKEFGVILNINEKIKIGSYICGPLNDVIFVICRVIKLLISEGNKTINLLIYEDELNWYFNVEFDKKIQDSESFEQIRKFIVYIKNVKPKFNEHQISIIIKKIR